MNKKLRNRILCSDHCINWLNAGPRSEDLQFLGRSSIFDKYFDELYYGELADKVQRSAQLGSKWEV